MKELKMPKEMYFEEYDLHVRPYLTLEEVVSIGELVVQADNPIEQEMTIAMNTLICCTELTAEDFQAPEIEGEEDSESVDVDVLDIGDIMISGMWDEIKFEIANISMVYDYVRYFESPQIAIAKFLNQTLPNMLDKYVDRLPKDGEWEEVIEKLPKSLNEVLELAKEDGNADIIRGAFKMGEE
jgi:hypothetical protein